VFFHSPQFLYFSETTHPLQAIFFFHFLFWILEIPKTLFHSPVTPLSPKFVLLHPASFRNSISILSPLFFFVLSSHEFFFICVAKLVSLLSGGFLQGGLVCAVRLPETPIKIDFFHTPFLGLRFFYSAPHF